jgi:hypothetical protein
MASTMANPSKTPPPDHDDAERTKAREDMGRAVDEIRRSVQERRVPEPSLDEISAEIRRIRAERKARKSA